ncbi:hypothetical protein ACT43G_12565 [Acinetobacter baumannii]
MKPEQFIREFGVEKARDLLDQREKFVHVEKPTHFDTDLEIFIHEADFRTGKLDESDINLSDLKRLVGSLDLVQLLGGIDALNGLLDMANSPFSLSGITRDGVFYSSEKIKELAQVHESIYGGGDE